MSREALDGADRTIIELLQADGRMPFTRIAAEQTAAALAELPEAECLIATSGRYDAMLEVIVDDDDHLMRLLSGLRRRDDVVEVESFVCLKVFKQTFSWGAR